MAELFADRFTLGIGASTRTIIEDWNGVTYDEPFHRTKDILSFLQRALAGEKITEEFRTFSVRNFQLERAPEKPPRTMVAALRPGMLKLAGNQSDGAILSWVAVEDLPRIQAIVGPGKTLAARVFVCPSTDRDQVLAIARRQIAWYANAPRVPRLPRMGRPRRSLRAHVGTVGCRRPARSAGGDPRAPGR
jgi:hypothetical protein